MAKKFNIKVGPAQIPVTIFRKESNILMGCPENLDMLPQPLCIKIEDGRNKAQLAVVGKFKPNGNGFSYVYQLEVVSGSIIF